MDVIEPDAVPARLIEHARRLYQDLSAELTRTIDQLRAGAPAPDAKTSTETLRAHRKALQTILDFEMQLLKQSPEGGDATHGLDLDAARAEVFGRLDRLLAAQHGGEPA